MSDRELVAQEIVKRLFVDLRDRKLLKWFFPPADEYDPDFFIGDITVKPITPEVQEEIAAAWRQIVLAALSDAGRLRAEVTGESKHHVSWGGFNISGDKKSADEVLRLIHIGTQLDEYRAAFDNRTAALKTQAADAERRVQELLHMLELVKSVLDENRFVGDNNPFGIRDIVGAAIHHKGTRKCSTP